MREGRTVYDNLKKAIIFLLPINGGEALAIVVAILLGSTLPITPLQILWVNMVSSLALAMTFAFEPTERGRDAPAAAPARRAAALGLPRLAGRAGLGAVPGRDLRHVHLVAGVPGCRSRRRAHRPSTRWW